jgi:hypothetical protein
MWRSLSAPAPAGRRTSTHSSGRRSRACSRLLTIADLRSASTWTSSHAVTVDQQVRALRRTLLGSKGWAGGVQIAALRCSSPIQPPMDLLPCDRMTRPLHATISSAQVSTGRRARCGKEVGPCGDGIHPHPGRGLQGRQGHRGDRRHHRVQQAQAVTGPTTSSSGPRHATSMSWASWWWRG